MLVKITVALLVMLALTSPATARADDTDTEICTAWNLGTPQGDIPGDLTRNDHRITPWQAQQRTNWDIIEGRCDQ
ncbi:hypothetical protein [Mycobacterium sp. M23085]|uniref:hypothetical protein n=1 Tax=Mycobacterium sp. M23085 TaxID=3378087 RepID=UPI0038779E11